MPKETLHKLTPNYMIFHLMKQLMRGTSYGMPGTDGSLKSIVKFGMEQDHTLYGLRAAHPIHPFMYCLRLEYLFCTLGFVFFITATLERNKHTRLLECIAVTFLVLMPFKKLCRLVWACPCLSTGGYDSGHDLLIQRIEVIDRMSAHLLSKASINSGKTGTYANCCRCCIQMIGICAKYSLLLFGLIFWYNGFLIAHNLPNHEIFVWRWIANQLFYIIIGEPVQYALLQYVKMDLLGWPQQAFAKKWAHRLEEGQEMPVNITHFALMARRSCIAILGTAHFLEYYPEYDSWFCIDAKNETVVEPDENLDDAEKGKDGGGGEGEVVESPLDHSVIRDVVPAPDSATTAGDAGNNDKNKERGL